MTKVYSARLATRITTSVDTRLRQLSLRTLAHTVKALSQRRHKAALIHAGDVANTIPAAAARASSPAKYPASARSEHIPQPPRGPRGRLCSPARSGCGRRRLHRR